MILKEKKMVGFNQKLFEQGMLVTLVAQVTTAATVVGHSSVKWARKMILCRHEPVRLFADKR